MLILSGVIGVLLAGVLAEVLPEVLPGVLPEVLPEVLPGVLAGVLTVRAPGARVSRWLPAVSSPRAGNATASAIVLLLGAVSLLSPPAGLAAQPISPEPAAERLRALEGEMTLRRNLLGGFGEGAVPAGERLTSLNAQLRSVYFRHEAATHDAIELIGGVAHVDARRGDGRQSVVVVHPDTQRLALTGVLATLDPFELSVPARLVTLAGEEGALLNPVAWSRELTERVLGELTARERMERLVLLRLADPENVSVHEVLSELVRITWRASPPPDPMSSAVLRVCRRAVLDRLLALGGDGDASPEVRAAATLQLDLIARGLAGRTGRLDRLLGLVPGPEGIGIRAASGALGRLWSRAAGDFAEEAHASLALRDIQRFLATY